MVLITNNWRLWLLGMASSLIIFGVVFFTVIQPNENAANQALKTGLQQTQKVIKQSQKAVGGNKAAQSTLNRAQKLTACVQAAGTDASKLTACQAKFGH